METIKTVSIEGHQNVLESQVEFDYLDQEELPPRSPFPLQEEPADDQQMLDSPTNNHSIIEVSKTPTHIDHNKYEKATPLTTSNGVEKTKPFPRASKKKLVYASEATDMYRQSLEKKNKIKENYYAQKIETLKRIAVAKERSACAKEDMAKQFKEHNEILSSIYDSFC